MDVPDQGIRPVIDSAKCKTCGECVKICPGVEIAHSAFDGQSPSEVRTGWGPVLEVYAGYATDAEIRFAGSSGGAATALAYFCLKKGYASSVLHVGAKPEDPLRNTAVFSQTREELLACTGSRYSPAAPCERLKRLDGIDSLCVFVGKPCDVAGLRKLQAVNAALSRKVGLAISIFCAGVPSTMGTVKLLEAMHVEPQEVDSLRYRGCGWPGRATVRLRGNTDSLRQMSYEESWGGILSRYVPLRCRLCPDGTGEFADISCGDPWYKNVEPGDPGQSLVLVRTARGKQILMEAMACGYVKMEQVDPGVILLSQKALLAKRSKVWGRQLAFRVLSIPSPRFTGFFLFANWCRLPTYDKIRSVAGTLRRAICQKWTKPLSVDSQLHKGG